MSDPQATLAAPQPQREIATIGDGRDITRGYLGPLLVPQDRLLVARGDDYRVWEHVLSEPQVQSTLQQRRNAIIQCEWRVDPASDARVDKKAAEFLQQQLQNIGWDRITGLMHYAVFYGFGAAEVVYGRDGSAVTLDKIMVRNRRRFRFDGDKGLRLQTFANMIPGEPCEAPYFWSFCTGADNDDDPYGVGLAHWLYWPVLFKRNGLKFWLTFLEKFGMPTAMGTYGQNATAEEQSRLLGATQAIQTDSGVIIPEGMSLTLLEAARSGTADYSALQSMLDETIAKVVLGQSTTSEGKGAGINKGEMQRDVRQDLVKADADLICESFNQTVVRWLTAWNFPSAQPPRVYRVVEEEADQKTMVDRDAVIASMGFKPSAAYINETYGGEWTESTPPAANGQVGLPSPGRGAVSGAAKDPSPASFAAADPSEPRDSPAAMADQLDRALQPTMTRWISKLHGLVSSAKSLDEVRDGIMGLEKDMSLDDYATVMAQALAAAALAGRNDIVQEASNGGQG